MKLFFLNNVFKQYIFQLSCCTLIYKIHQQVVVRRGSASCFLVSCMDLCEEHLECNTFQMRASGRRELNWLKFH